MISFVMLLAYQVVVAFEALGQRTQRILTHDGSPVDSPGATGWTMALDDLAAWVGSGNRAT